MPYIKPEDRSDLFVDSVRDAVGPGELNYQLTILIKRYWMLNKSYSGINDIIGALEGAKMEFYRRIVVPYEELKMHENGDVYRV